MRTGHGEQEDEARTSAPKSVRSCYKKGRSGTCSQQRALTTGADAAAPSDLGVVGNVFQVVEDGDLIGELIGRVVSIRAKIVDVVATKSLLLLLFPEAESTLSCRSGSGR
jgi:hypothetical protein